MLLLKRKRQDDINCFDEGADKRNRCKTPEKKVIFVFPITRNKKMFTHISEAFVDMIIWTTVVEGSPSNSLMNISETQVVNEETGSEIKSI